MLDQLKSSGEDYWDKVAEETSARLVGAMATGCVAVVPRDGGLWFDLLDGKQESLVFLTEACVKQPI